MARKPFNFRQNEDLKQQDSVKTTSFSRNNDASSLVEEEEEEVVVVVMCCSFDGPHEAWGCVIYVEF